MMRKLVMAMLMVAAAAQAQDLGKSKLGDAMNGPPPPSPQALAGQGNLPPDFYPKSPCGKPDASSIGDKPRDARDIKAVQEYNQRIQTYNRTAQAFNGCITDYAAKARNDIERIQQAIRDANAR